MVDAIVNNQISAALFELPRRNRFQRYKMIIEPRRTAKTTLFAGLGQRRSFHDQALGLIECHHLQKTFGCNAGPLAEKALEMEHTQVNVRGNLFQRWLLLNMGSQKADGFGDTLIVVVKCCHDVMSMWLVDKAVEPDLAEMIITLDDTCHQKALRHLRKHDKKLSAVIARTRACELSPRPHLDLFGTLAHAIVGQQLSVKAAATIYARFCVLLGAADGQPHPYQLQGISLEQLRSVGLSQAKALAVLDLAAKIDSGQVLALAELESLDDESVIQNLIQVRGVGRWTAEMFLMFQMGRADVLPVDDLGIRKGFMLVYGLDVMPDKKWMTACAQCWQPYRSVASWYLWRAAE